MRKNYQNLAAKNQNSRALIWNRFCPSPWFKSTARRAACGSASSADPRGACRAGSTREAFISIMLFGELLKRKINHDDVGRARPAANLLMTKIINMVLHREDDRRESLKNATRSAGCSLRSPLLCSTAPTGMRSSSRAQRSRLSHHVSSYCSPVISSFRSAEALLIGCGLHAGGCTAT